MSALEFSMLWGVGGLGDSRVLDFFVLGQFQALLCVWSKEPQSLRPQNPKNLQTIP